MISRNLKSVFKTIVFLMIATLGFIFLFGYGQEYKKTTINNNLTKADNTFENTTNYKPEFYGTIEINVNVNDEVDIYSGMYRILAKDFEDGNITNKIQVLSNNVDTSKVGNYIIKYRVMDSDNNESIIEVPVNVSDSGKRTIKRKIYDYSNYADIITFLGKTSYERGNTHDKQSLGIYLPANTSVNIRALNHINKELTVEYLNDNRLKESPWGVKDDNAPLYGEDWPEFGKMLIYMTGTNTKISTNTSDYKLENIVNVKYRDESSKEYVSLENYDGKSYDCIPFIDTPIYETNVIIEVELNDSIKSVDYYTYDDTWNPNMESDVAILEGSRATFLIPKCDYADLGKSKKESNPTEFVNDNFNSLNDILAYYDNLIETYDKWIGLSYGDEQISDRNINNRYFIKADPSCSGAAVYDSNAVEVHSKTLDAFVHNQGDGWMPLHEIGHGYQGSFESSYLYLREVSNNFLAYHFQQLNLEGNWLRGIETIEKEIMNGVDETEYSYLLNDDLEKVTRLETVDEAVIRLYAYVNLFNKVGFEETWPKINSNDRLKKYTTSESRNALEILVEEMADVTGYNVIPYFERWKAYVTKEEKIKYVYNKDYPILYCIRDLVNSDEQAEIIKNDLGQVGIYSLVTPDELAKYNLKGNVNITLSEDLAENLKGDIVIKNGDKVVKTISNTGALTYNNIELPIGAYEVETSNDSIVIDKHYVIVKEDSTTDLELKLKKIIESVELKSIDCEKNLMFNVGEQLGSDTDIKLTYTNGDTKSIPITSDGVEVTGFSTAEKGKYTMYIKYNDIYCDERYIVDDYILKVKNTPRKIVYNVGEELNLYGGILLEQSYDGNSKKEIDMNSDGVVISGYNKNQIGKQTLTAEYKGLKATFDVNVIDESIEYICIDSLPDKIKYHIGDKELDLENGTLKVHKKNGTSEIISLENDNVKITGFDCSKAGEVCINANYNGIDCSYNIIVVGLSVTKDFKNTYVQNEEQLDLTGGELTYMGNDGKKEIVSTDDESVSVTGFNNNTLGKNTLTITYKGIEINYDVDIVEKKVDDIEIITLPTAWYYRNSDEELKLEKGRIKVEYSDGSHEIIEMTNPDIKITGLNTRIPEKINSEKLYVEYKGAETSYTVYIRNVEDVLIENLPDKVEYIQGYDAYW